MMRMVATVVLAGMLLCGAGCSTPPANAPANETANASANNDASGALRYMVPDRQLTADEAAALDAKLNDTEGNLKQHVDLLWHYRNQFTDPKAAAAANSHLLWIVTHHPDAHVLGTPIAQLPALPGDPTVEVFAKLWKEQTARKGHNARVQGHAGLFFKLVDAGRALRLLEHAHALDKDEPLWLEHLGDLYVSRGKAETIYDKWFAKAVQAYGSALPLITSSHHKQQLLPKLAMAQLRAGQLEAAQQSADQLSDLLIKETGDTDDLAVARHGLHVIRGAIAVKRGAPDIGANELKQAGNAIKGRSISLWRLDMALADRLQSRKRWLAVITYLDTVERVTDDRAVDEWISRLKQNRSAQFDDYIH